MPSELFPRFTPSRAVGFVRLPLVDYVAVGCPLYRPQPVPFVDVISRDTSDSGNNPCCINVAGSVSSQVAYDCAAIYTGAERVPSGAIPFSYSLCRDTSSGGKATTDIEVAGRVEG